METWLRSLFTTLIELVRLRVLQLHLPNKMRPWDFQSGGADLKELVFPSSGELMALINLLLLAGENVPHSKSLPKVRSWGFVSVFLSVPTFASSAAVRTRPYCRLPGNVTVRETMVRYYSCGRKTK